MTTFRYNGISKDGAKVNGVVTAYDEFEAVAQLKEKCSVITKIEEIRDANTKKEVKVKIGEKDLAVLCSQFSIILASGLPIVRCVEMVANQAKDKNLQEVLLRVAADIGGGYSMAQSFENNCRGLPTTFIETIRAGEESGTLEHCFDRLKVYYDKHSKLKGKLVSALTYPSIVICVAVVVFVIIMVVAVPTFTTVFADLGVDLPGVTKALIATSNFLTQYWWVLAIIGVTIFAVRYFIISNPDRKRKLDNFKLTKGPMHKLNVMNACNQFASTMSTMVASGLPIIRSLEVTANTLDNSMFAYSIRQVRVGVEQGKTISEGMEQVEFIPKMLTEMTGVGEVSGEMESTLDVVADYYANEVDVLTGRLMSALEPAITCLLAGMVVVLLLAVYMPMFGMLGSM